LIGAPTRGVASGVLPARAGRAWGVAFLATYVVIRCALESRYALFDPDEALEMLAAGSLREGRLPYLGALSHRGPFLTLLYGVPCGLFGPSDYRAVHAFSIALFVVVAFVFQRAVARATTESVGLFALSNLLLLATLRVPTEDNWGLNSDFLMAALVTVGMSVLLFTRGSSVPMDSPARSDAAYGGVGLLLALAFLTKQNAAPYLAVPIGYVALVDRRRELAKLGWLASGFALPLALSVGVYLAAGQLHRAWYFFYEYNRDYAAAGYAKGLLAATRADSRWLIRSYGELLALGCLGGVAFARRRGAGRARVRLLAVLWTLAGIAAALAPGKDWDNYLWAGHAPVALLAALGEASLLELVDERRWGPSLRRVGLAAVMAVPMMGSIAQLGRGRTTLATRREVGGIPPPRVPRRELLDIVAATTGEDDTIYVTGYAPEMYVLSARRPASRHAISNFVEDVFPGRFETPSRLVPRFFDELREDLAQNRPRVILDACALGFLCHPSSALTEALPRLLGDYHRLSPGPRGVYVRNE
jgi:hypothetical protein